MIMMGDGDHTVLLDFSSREFGVRHSVSLIMREVRESGVSCSVSLDSGIHGVIFPSCFDKIG